MFETFGGWKAVSLGGNDVKTLAMLGAALVIDLLSCSPEVRPAFEAGL